MFPLVSTWERLRVWACYACIIIKRGLITSPSLFYAGHLSNLWKYGVFSSPILFYAACFHIFLLSGSFLCSSEHFPYGIQFFFIEEKDIFPIFDKKTTYFHNLGQPLRTFPSFSSCPPTMWSLKREVKHFGIFDIDDCGSTENFMIGGRQKTRQKRLLFVAQFAVNE